MTFKKAREAMAEGLKDRETRQGYVANIACLLYDNQRTPSVREDLKKMAGANKMAERLLKLIFE